MYRDKGREAYVDRMARHGIAARKLAEAPSKWVVMLRKSLLRDFEAAGVIPNSNDVWSWSMWNGYLKNEDGVCVQEWFAAGGTRANHIHTSGHASPDDLRKFAHSIRAKSLVPIHGIAWDGNMDGFPSIKRLHDGEVLVI